MNKSRKFSVLVVDDEKSNILTLMDILKPEYTVYVATSGHSAIEMAEKHLPDIILLDIIMPEMDGYEVITTLKAAEKTRHIPVIFVTGLSSADDEEKGLACGVSDYITKPFSQAIVKLRVQNQIKQIELKGHEDDERMRLMLNAMPLACSLINREHRFINMNKASMDMFGVLEDQENITEKYLEMLPEFQPCGRRSIELTYEYIEKAFKEGYQRFEWVYKKPDGETIPCEDTLIRVKYKGEYILAGYSRDLREEKAIIEEIQKTKIAEESNKAKSQFLANMSHEIRTPMNSIMGFAELALDKTAEPQVRDYLGKITDSTKWLLHIINDILDISKIESGKMELEHVPFDLQDIVTRCQSVILPDVRERGLDFKIHVEPLSGKNLVGDPVRIYQVIMNLLSNSVKFTKTGFVSLSSCVKKLDDNSADVYFEVKDSGIGMTTEQVEKVFTPFIQADSSTTRKYGGTGLGLAITRNIVEMMGSRLSVESAPGAGSKFCFNIIFNTVDAADTLICETSLNEIEKPFFEGEILICEDNPMNQYVIREHLARVGLRAVMADNGKIGVDMIKKRLETGEKPFDLIFMDIHMPVMDGLEAASKIASMNTGIPIVAMTANIMTNDKELYKENGMPDCVDKPFTSQELWRCLLRYLRPVEKNTVNQNASADRNADAELLLILKLNFVRYNKNKFDEFAKALETDDIKLAHRIAHTLKSNAGQLGKGRLQKAAAELEALLKDGKNLTTKELLNTLETELTAVLGEYAPLVTETSPPPEGTAFDKEKALELAKQLEGLLKSGNPKCLNFIDALCTISGTEELIQQIDNFDFDLALCSLAKLTQDWKS